MRVTRLFPAVLIPLTACAGGSPSAPSIDPADLHTVNLIVFYDENGNGRLDAAEGGRVPGVQLEMAGLVATSEAGSGRAVFHLVPAAQQPLSLRAGTLPPFYAAHAPASVRVPAAADVDVPLTLSIGANRPNRYMAFGDSITEGDGSSDGTGYRTSLEAKLQAHFGRGEVSDASDPGSRSTVGASRIGASLVTLRPAYSLILYGTNDWNDSRCKTAFPCYTIDNLRSMVRRVKNDRSLPVLGAILPVNVGFDERTPPSRQDWVREMNILVRELAKAEGALLVDFEAAFLKAGDLTGLFSDHVHPNDKGYALMSDEWFKAISQPASRSGPSFDAFDAGLGFAQLAPRAVSSGPRQRRRSLPGIAAHPR